MSLSTAIRAGEQILTVIWIGSLWTIGFLVAPTLFHMLDERALAGLIAGRLFSIESYLGLLCGGLLLLLAWYRIPPGQRVSWRMVVLGTMLIIVAVGEFGLKPLLAEYKAQGLSTEFARWHGVSAILYLLNCLLGFGLIITGDQGS